MRPDLTLVPFKLPPDFLAELDRKPLVLTPDEARAEARGHRSRSHYIREAIAEKLGASGVTITDVMIFPADRAGVGGRPRGYGAQAQAAPAGGEDGPRGAAEKVRQPVSYRKSLAADRRKARKKLPPPPGDV